MEALGFILSNLSLSDNKETVLAELKPALSKLSRAEVSAGINCVDLIPVFDCLNTDKAGQIEACCSILQYLLTFMDPELVVDKYGVLIKRGLLHNNPSVPVLVLKQLQRCARDEDLASRLGSHDIYPVVLGLMDAELIVSREVIVFLDQLAESKPGLAVVTNVETVNVLKKIMTNSEITKFRVLELVVKIGQMSQEHLDRMDDVGLLVPLVELLGVEDVLVRLNAIELITNVALTHQGLRYLESRGVLMKMEAVLKESQNDPFSGILLPALVKFFGNIAHLRPKQMIVQHPNFVESLFQMTDSSDLTHKAIAFETIGYIGVSLEGKSSLNDLGNKLINSIEKLENLIKDSPTEIRIRGMNAFASLIKLDKENQTAEFLLMTESWFTRALGHRPVNLLAELVKQPFPELRLAAYLILQNIAKQVWGRRLILREPGFPELLLDRSQERVKDGQDAKFHLMTCLTESGDSADTVGAEMDVLLREYVRRGPYYVQVQSQVAFEDGN